MEKTVRWYSVKEVWIVFVIFMGVMIFVTATAYARPSGNTRQDMSLAPAIRNQSASPIKPSSTEK